MYKKITELLFRRNSYAFSNFILKMKLTIFLMIIGLLQIKAEGSAQQVSLNVKKASLTEIIAALRDQTNIDFLFNDNTVKDFKPVTLNLHSKDILTVLDACFKNQSLSYKLVNHSVLITEKEQPDKNKPVPVSNVPNEQRVTGVVRDSTTHETIPGATVLIDGTNKGTKTDENGRYSIEVQSSETIIDFSFVGYNTKKVMVGNRTILDVNLSASQSKLNEVVIVGYGTRTKGAITGAISTVKAEVFENRPINNVYDALEGEIPGVTITTGSGAPGNQQYSLQVRGYSTINGSTPFILIDGVPGDMSNLSPADISSVTVLKDAAAAIYGNRAADGVILITTKQGKKGPLLIDYSTNVAVKQPTDLKKMMNTSQFATFMSNGLENVGQTGFPSSVFTKIQNNAPVDSIGWNYGLSNYPGFYGNTDWNKIVFKDGIQTIHNLSISGGGDTHTFLLSGSYDHDGGTLRYGDSYANRYNLRFNNTLQLSKNLDIQTRTEIVHTLTDMPTQINATDYNSILYQIPNQFPYQPLYNPLGEFYSYQGYQNPALYLTQGGQSTFWFTGINTNFLGNYRPLPGLTITGQAAIRLNFSNSDQLYPTFIRNDWYGGVQGLWDSPNYATYANSRTTYQLYQVYADYNKQLGQDHHIDLTVGTSLEKTNNEGQSITGYNFPNNDILTLNLADKTNLAYINYTGDLNNQTLESYFGRLSYSFKNKFILDVTARSDASTKFAPNERWSQLFPSVAFAYNLSEERFIKDMNIFDQLKLRASYGKAGNQDINALGLFDYTPLISIGGVYPLGSPNAGLPGAVASPASQTRTWETITNKNIGIDLQVLQSRLSFSFDYFNKINNDMLVAVAVPATFGATPPTENQGKLVTKGFETTVSWRDHIGELRYSVMLQLSDNHNKLVQLKNSDNYVEGLNQTRQGYPIDSYFGYVYDGIIKTQAQLDAYKKLTGVPTRIALGDVMYKDVDGDGALTEYGDPSKGKNGDMVYLGNAIPRYTYSSNISLQYKQLDLSVFLQGVGKRMVQYGGSNAIPAAFYYNSLQYYFGKTWTPDNPNAQYPRYLPGSLGYDDVRGYDYHTSSLTLQNDAYLRFKTITLGYNIPAAFAQKLKMKSARLYVSGTNLITISKGTLGGNYDPEDANLNASTYPFNKVYSLGLDVKF
jgi:TonB-linked SusC/RagA family outer membrane protein